MSKLVETIVRSISDSVTSTLAEQYAKDRIAIDYGPSKNKETYEKEKNKLKYIYMGKMNPEEKNAFIKKAQIFYNACIAEIKSK